MPLIIIRQKGIVLLAQQALGEYGRAGIFFLLYINYICLYHMSIIFLVYRYNLKCIFIQISIFYMRKTHILIVHCTNIQRKRFNNELIQSFKNTVESMGLKEETTQLLLFSESKGD